VNKFGPVKVINKSNTDEDKLHQHTAEYMKFGKIIINKEETD
jgi:hypothetical protein